MSSLPPLRSPEGEYGEFPSLYRFLCLDKSFPLRSPPCAPCKVTFIPCPGVTLLCSLQRVSPHSVGFVLCPNKSDLSSRVTLTRSLSFWLIGHLLALLQRCLGSMPGFALRRRFAPAPCLAIRLALQRLGCRSSGFSAPPADPAPAVPLAMASAAPMTGSAPPHPCVSTLEGSTSPTSYRRTTVPASLRGSGDTGDTGALAAADHAPLLPLDV